MKLTPAYRLNPLFAPALLGSDRWPNLLSSLLDNAFGKTSDATIPALNAYEDNESYLVHIELPGVKKEDVKIELEGSELTVQASRKLGKDADEGAIQYSRSLTLPESIRNDAVSAELKDGVLAIRIPKAAESKPRQISVQ
ncbi:MAG: Hsp20/alpha crystallin family protein [Puniceicoccales bacterium]|jgi:HSP20 family protein|nr:Hsp20/alpha crystallin family protein [Puniceicoccales bacterium]